MTILDFLRRSGPASTDEIMKVLDLSKTATRAHLLQLEAEGAIARQNGESTGRGRPPVVFSLTEEGSLRFPAQDGEILSEFLQFMEREGERETVKRFFTEIWSRRRELLERKLPSGSLERSTLNERLEALQELLEETDFMPEIQRDGDRVKVRECNCPLPAAARATRIPCELEACFLAEVVGGELVKASFARRRRDDCCFEIDVNTE